MCAETFSHILSFGGLMEEENCVQPGEYRIERLFSILSANKDG